MKKRKPGKPVHLNMYEEAHKVKGAKKLPLTLQQSLSHLNNSKVLKTAFGNDVIRFLFNFKK